MIFPSMAPSGPCGSGTPSSGTDVVRQALPGGGEPVPLGAAGRAGLEVAVHLGAEGSEVFARQPGDGVL